MTISAIRTSETTPSTPKRGPIRTVDSWARGADTGGGGAATARRAAASRSCPSVGGFVMIAIGSRRFAAAGTNIPPTLPTTALVVDGIYGRTRNPLYLGLILIYLGLGVAAGSLWAIGLVVPLLWVINVGVVKREERYLERKFGDAYRDYKARVRRWI